MLQALSIAVMGSVDTPVTAAGRCHCFSSLGEAITIDSLTADSDTHRCRYHQDVNERKCHSGCMGRAERQHSTAQHLSN